MLLPPLLSVSDEAVISFDAQAFQLLLGGGVGHHVGLVVLRQFVEDARVVLEPGENEEFLSTH